MKYNAGGNTPRTIDPTLTRKRGALSHPGSLLIAAVALLFFAYIFGYLPQADTAYNSLIRAIDGQRENAISVYKLAEPIGICLVLIALVAYLWTKASAAIRHGSKRSLVAGRPSLSEAQFAEMAAKHSISAKVAHQAYKMLRTDYTASMKVNLKDSLRNDLYWNETHLLDVMGDLARRCDRKKNLKATVSAVRTVLDLLLYVESCPKQFLTESEANRRDGIHAAPKRPSKMQRALSGVTRMLKPLHKRSDVVKAVHAKTAEPAHHAKPAEPAHHAKPVQVAPQVEKKPMLSFIRPRKYPPSVDAPK